MKYVLNFLTIEEMMEQEIDGANRQIRTADLTLTKGALYQLSYISAFNSKDNGADGGNRTRSFSLEG